MSPLAEALILVVPQDDHEPADVFIRKRYTRRALVFARARIFKVRRIFLQTVIEYCKLPRSPEVALECFRSNGGCAPLLAQAGLLEEQLPGDHVGWHRAKFGGNRVKVPCGLLLIVGCAGLDDLLEKFTQNLFDSNLVNLIEAGVGSDYSPLLYPVFEYVPPLVPLMRFLARLLS